MEERKALGVESSQNGILNKLTTISMRAAAAGVIIAFLLVNYGVISRYFFNISPTWIDDIVGYILIFVVMAASAKNLYKAQHLYVDILTSYITKHRPSWQPYFELWSQISVLLFCGLLIYSALDSIEVAIQFGLTTTDNMQAPLQYLLTIVLLGAVLMACVSIVGLVQALKQMRQGK